MTVLHRAIKWVMVLSGLLTCTMFYAAIAPEAALRSYFGQAVDGPVAQIVVRNWGSLIGQELLPFQVGVAVIVDSVTVLLFAAYLLITVRR